ncbi:proto-oncogene c-Fos isoform X2 [Sinocyclocheilus rhinocerous]|uniref:proto-oncogene c-Fos isoform X2 n=1 Tax=Sinocyclocheilus rhinocerous TaxID=307959 RepID=UPI0007B7F113|nr:PREDICTED: proto-oncogene c-Fos-like isoform X2 [Sinocyclocheilus rhinocerous]
MQLFIEKNKSTEESPQQSCVSIDVRGNAENCIFPSQLQGSFVPTVTAISSTPDLQWMVQPTIITSVSPCLGRAESSEPAKSKPAGNKGKCAARKSKSKSEQLSPEEEERKRIRRERNKMAAAKCRNRRRELTDTLQAETDKLEEDKAALQAEIENLLKEKERLEYVLASHKPLCQLPEELDCLFPESPQPLPTPEMASKLPEDGLQDAASLQDLEIPTVPSTAISGNSNILLCSSAEVSLCDLEPSLEVKDELLAAIDKDRVSAETARSVPDIDLTGSLGITDWETLYKSVANDLEPLSTPVVSTSTPTCSNYLSVFTFACPELDSLAEGLDGCKGDWMGMSKAESSVDILNSPTLLAL